VAIPKKKTLGQTVYRLRNNAEMTQEALAEKAEISRRYLQMVEAGRYSPTVEVTSRLRMALKVSWDELLKGL
jgi:transcriptional regulator with XRE-family HTH domain